MRIHLTKHQRWVINDIRARSIILRLKLMGKWFIKREEWDKPPIEHRRCLCARLGRVNG